MVYSYYPGCTLKTKARRLDEYGRFAAEALGVTLTELADWQCCGGTYTTARDEIATKLSAVRSLAASRDNGSALVTLCAACHNVLKQVNHDMAHDEAVRAKANAYLALESPIDAPLEPYTGDANVIHYLELLRDVIGFDAVKKAVTKPFAGVKVAAFYGCLLLRPSAVLSMDNAENPTIMEDLIRALGADAVVYPLRNECCGSYLALEDAASVAARSGAVLKSAADAGAELIVTACPLCLYNLNRAAGTGASDGADTSGAVATDGSAAHKPNTARVPVVYFTELLAAALGNADAMASIDSLKRDNSSVKNINAVTAESVPVGGTAAQSGALGASGAACACNGARAANGTSKDGSR